MMIGQTSNALQTRHPTVKCVVWDLDNTLWDGLLLEDEQVTLRHGIVEVIKTLDSRGILHSIASKNDYAVALEKLQNFGLSDYFLYPQINWNSKASSIRHIAQLMNLSLDTFAFVDDQPFERDEVNFALPEVLCIDAKDILTLPALPEMMPRFLTRDSQNRRKMYLSDIIRKQIESEFIGSNEEFLATLEMVFTVAPCTEDDLQRAEELTVRTHQLNTTGYTYSYDELNALRLSQRHKLWIASLDDKYGSYGKIGLALVECQADVWVIKLLLMSCRVMSRGVGTLMLNYIMQEAKAAGMRLQAEFISNNRNRMMLVTYKFSGFKEIGQDNESILLENDLSIIQPFPAYVKVHIEEAPTLDPTRSLRPCHLLTLSAKTETALAEMSTILTAYCKQNEQISLADMAYTLQIGCQEFNHRKMLVGSDLTATMKELETGGSKGQVIHQHQATLPVAFLFAGVGEQFVGIAQGFYLYEPFFRSIVDQCCEFLLPLLHIDLRNLLYPDASHNLVLRTSGILPGTSVTPDKQISPGVQLLQQTDLAQPLMFVIEYTLARMLMHWGIIPQALLGYSLGEYVAACLAEVFSLEDALWLVARRAILIGQQPVGVMLAVLCSAQQVQPFLSNDMKVELAVTNSPLQCVLAGPEEGIAQVEALLQEANIVSLRLRNGQAFHSHLLERAQDALQEDVRQIKRQTPTIPYISNVTGTWISQQEIENDEYWGRHMCETARFAEGLEQLVKDGLLAFMEIGPGSSLGSLVKQWELTRQAERRRKEPLIILSSLRRAGEKRQDHEILLEAIGKYWLAGGQVNWEAFWEEERRPRIPLPTYPFERLH
jgi:FkbH-like protein